MRRPSNWKNGISPQPSDPHGKARLLLRRGRFPPEHSRPRTTRRKQMAKQPRILAGETAAITGGARGIGRATAEALLGVGMRVAIGDVDLETARKPASELGPSVVALPLDVTDRESFAAFLDQAEEQLGPLDVLVNNAGIIQIGRFIDAAPPRAARDVHIHPHR